MASTEQIALQLQKLANQSTEKSFQYNTKEANTARTWQKMMSDTSHQREVADLKKAGLNPVLSAGGSGAQSYTTSAASASADNAVNAIGGVYSSKIGADATRAAAAASAAAMRQAAATQAAAQRYAAAMNYQTQKYVADRNYQSNEMAWNKKMEQLQYQIKHTPVSNKWQFLDKYLDQTGVTGNAVGTIKGIVSKVVNDPSKYLTKFNNTVGEVTKLTQPGNIVFSKALKSLGVPVTSHNIQLFIDGFIKGNRSSRSKLQTIRRFNLYQYK